MLINHYIQFVKLLKLHAKPFVTGKKIERE
jgi:hypothetical protein